MAVEFNMRKSAVPIFGSACLFAAVFWFLDAGSALWGSNIGLASAIVPDGTAFLSRLAYAAVFALAGSIAGAALQRSRDIEEFAIDKLQESERKYQALMASSFDSVITLDGNARIVEVSESAAAMFDGTRAHIAGRQVDELVAVEAAGRARAATVSELLRNGVLPPSDVKVTARRDNGRRFPAEIRVTPMPVGSESAYVLAIRETTSQLVAQKALRHSERRYQSLFDNILEGVYRSTPDGRLLAANPALVNMLGFESQEDFTNRANARDFYADAEQRKQLITLLNEKKTARNFEILLRRRDGSTLPALANIRAVTSDNNEDVVYEGSLTDISDLVRAREALVTSEANYRMLCEHALDIVNVIDADGEILYSSPSSTSLSGRPPESQVGLKLFRNVHPDDVNAVTEIIAAGFSRPGTAHSFTCRVFRHDGQERLIEAVGSAFLGHDGELRGVIHSRDITDRIESEAEQRNLQKLQVVGKMTDGLAHEFNNLLTVMAGNLDLLDEQIDDKSLQTHLRAAMHACQQGTDITRRLMAFADHQGASAEDVNPNGILMDLEAVLRRSMGEMIAVSMNYGDSLWQVSTDPVQLEAAILQLAMNAKAAMGQGGTLSISTSNSRSSGTSNGSVAAISATDCVCICISDTGSGMDNEVLSRATEPFYSTHGEPGHNGLGLSVVKNFVEASGGHLHIHSEPGEGTSVRLHLPRSRSEAGSALVARTAPQGDETILVVDDNADVRNASAALLRSLGYHVLEASSGQAALEVLNSEPVALLFTDLAMPRMSGLELAKTACNRYQNLKVLLTSGNEAAMAEANDSLNSRYEMIRKPFRKQNLAEHIRHAMDD
jgi:PAS domain S-box-containing protein